MEICFYEWQRARWDVSHRVRCGICFVCPNIREDGQIHQISVVLIWGQSACCIPETESDNHDFFRDLGTHNSCRWPGSCYTKEVKIISCCSQLIHSRQKSSVDHFHSAFVSYHETNESVPTYEQKSGLSQLAQAQYFGPLSQ